MAEKIPCCEEVPGEGQWGWLHKHTCRKAAVVERGGKWYCKIHDPVYIEDRDRKRREGWEQKWEADKKRWERENRITTAFKDVTLEQIRERIAAGQCPCCGKPRP